MPQILYVIVSVSVVVVNLDPDGTVSGITHYFFVVDTSIDNFVVVFSQQGIATDIPIGRKMGSELHLDKRGEIFHAVRANPSLLVLWPDCETRCLRELCLKIIRRNTKRKPHPSCKV